MDLVKYFRKHRTQILVWVVILAMIAFIGGSAFTQLMSQLRITYSPKMAKYDDGKFIRQTQYQNAQGELEVLRGLLLDRILMARQTQMGQPDIASHLLAMLLFPDAQAEAQMSMMLKQSSQRGQLYLGQEQIDSFFNAERAPGAYYWILLSAEANNAGVRASREEARQFISREFTQASQGQMDGLVLLAQAVNQMNIAEERILDIVAKLLSIISYTDIITATENVTVHQLKSSILANRQRFTAEYVQVRAQDFIDETYQPSDAQIQGQFEAYKDKEPGIITEDNPYGFGYKQPGRAQMDYLLVKMDDVEGLIDPVTSNDKEDFYRRNTSQFQYREPIDPNNPEAGYNTKLRTYAEVQGQIGEMLRAERMQKRADLIMNDLRAWLEQDLRAKEISTDSATPEQLEKYSRDFAGAAEAIGAKYKLSITVGKTGMMSLGDAMSDRYLSSLFLEGQSRMGVMLPRVIFAVDPINETTLSRFDVPVPKLYEIIGPAAGGPGTEGRVMGLFRIVEARAGFVPETYSVSYDTRGIHIGDAEPSGDETYSLLNEVIEDLRLEAAMKTAGERAGNLLALVKEKGWDEGLKSFNEKYLASSDTRLELDRMQSQNKATEMDIYVNALRVSPEYANNLREISRQIDEFEALLPEGQNRAMDIREVVEFKPTRSYYVVRDVTRTEVTRDQYERMKPMLAYQLGAINSGSLTLEHYHPGNIQERMKFEPIENVEIQPEEPVVLPDEGI